MYESIPSLFRKILLEICTNTFQTMYKRINWEDHFAPTDVIFSMSIANRYSFVSSERQHILTKEYYCCA